MTTEWTKRWNYEIATKASRPGIWRLRTGGFLLYARATCPKTGKRMPAWRQMPEATLVEATRARDQLLDELRRHVSGSAKQRPLWSAYAAQLFEDKVALGKLKSPKSRERWESTLRLHLIPAFGTLYVDELTRDVALDWYKTLARKVAASTLSPRTVNGWLSIFRVICNAMTEDFDLPKNPASKLVDFDTSEKPTYTDEEPNALTVIEARLFLDRIRVRYPSSYAITLLGFVTGLRPSSLRALRRKGETPDVMWEESAVLVRRSNARGQEVMNTTKTKKRQKIALPPAMMLVLREHVALLEQPPLSARGKPPLWWRPAMAESELLFPARTGGFRSRSALDKPFKETALALGLGKKLTPRAMRRSFQDLARAANMDSIVKRSVSGHATAVMEEHYSTVWQTEMRDGLGRVLALVEGPSEARGLKTKAESKAELPRSPSPMN